MSGSKRQPLKAGKENQNVPVETAEQRIERLEALIVLQAATISHLQDENQQLVRSNNEYRKMTYENEKTINKLKNDVKQLKDELTGENENSGDDTH
ncbi:unnamed protein product [Rotaria sp. Silwood1]|nr:unnamed protein product [Rotaria sp. Silwood1]CAF1689664.1 unnamed protein product [Rotaria sp. Silwood1]